MNYILDANILLRFADTASVQHPTTVVAIDFLRQQGFVPRTVPQSFFEFWVVATRPTANNGLGLTPIDCEATAAGLVTTFPILEDKPGLFAEWRALVVAHSCRGKVAHDARYVAAMKTHGITHILTFNTPDFARYPGITVLDPHVVAATAIPPRSIR